MDKDYFYFKNFRLRNRDAALKINTDGVLLAAWADTQESESLLDVGTAGGVIAFILAYRNPQCKLTGIDICTMSIDEANYNKSINEPTLDINFIEQSLQEHSLSNISYDHIVSNPPFFDVDLSSITKDETPKQKAKHSYNLSLEELLDCSQKLLNIKGKLSIIIDYRDEDKLKTIFQKHNFIISRILRVSGKPSHLPNRLLLELVKTTIGSIKENSISIRNENGSYTEEYKAMTKDWYLNF